jgi:hypothetical protein
LSLKRIPGLVFIVAVALAAAAGTATADPAPELPAGPILPQAEWPNDPGFAACELQDPVSGCTHREQWNLYGPMDGLCKAPGGVTFDQPRPDGGLPCWARNATDPEGSSGINMTGAWAQGNLGRDEMLIAYIEGGVNYSQNSIKDGLNSIYINPGELPYPQGWDGNDLGRHDFDGNGRFDIRDYARDPRVNPKCQGGSPQFSTEEEGTVRGCVSNGRHEYLHEVNIGGSRTPYLSPEDLIAVFGHCRIENSRVSSCPSGGRIDNDGNGYPNDVSGWNTYRNNNDPQTEDPGYGHASSLISLIGAEADNNYGDVGVCRECRVLPIKANAEAVGKTDNWTPALTYAVDAGARVVSSVVVSYSYSSAAAEAVEYAVDNDVLLSFDSNDFDSMDHTDGHLYEQVFPGNSVIANVDGSNVRSFRARSNVTSYGTHSIFSGGEKTTSGSTPFQAAYLGMVQSAAMDAVDAGKYRRTLTPNEVKQVLINTASPVVTQVDHPTVPNQWPGNPDSKTDATHSNWSTQYGYGRPNIGKATRLILDGRVPPSAVIDSPEWYRYVDPSGGGEIQVKGSVAPSAWGSQGIDWTLEWALGADPADSDFRTISTGKAGKTGVLGTLDLSRIPAGYAAKDPVDPLPPEGPEQYTVTLRLRARDGNGLKGEDRRSIGARTDPQLADGYPKPIGTEISAAPAWVDLTGKRRLELIYGTYDGTVSALGPDGKQIDGFPVKTRQLRYVDPHAAQNFDSKAYRSVRALREARDPVSGIAVGDLRGNGSQVIVASTASGWIYAWNGSGKLLRGFPARPDDSYATLPVPTPMESEDGARSPVRGNWSAPALGNLTGDGKLSILMSSFDGQVYAFRPDGKPVPGWPVRVTLPKSIRETIPPDELVRDPKLMVTPAVGDLLGTGTDQVFVPGFECDEQSNRTFAYGIHSDGNNHSGGPFMAGWPVPMASTGGCYSESIDFVQGGANSPSIADFDGSGRLQLAITPVAGFPVVLNADGSTEKVLAGSCLAPTCAGIPPYYGADPFTVGVTGQGAVGDLSGDGSPDYMQAVTGAITISSALGTAGRAALIHTFDQAWDVGDGKALPGFPVDQDGFPFFTSPLVASLSDDGSQSMIAANDSYWIHARDADGEEAPGFPKWTGQWTSFGGAVGDPGLDGRQRLAFGTREGYLFVWKVGGDPADNDQWWSFRHDEHNSGRYGNDTRPPAGIKAAINRKRKKAKLTWRAPGDNGVSNGKAVRYQIYRSKKPIKLNELGRTSRVKAPRPAEPARKQSIRLKVAKKRKLYVAFRSRDAAGNWSSLTRVKVPKFRKSVKQKIRQCKKAYNKKRKRHRGNHRALKRDRKHKKKCIRKARKSGKKS